MPSIPAPSVSPYLVLAVVQVLFLAADLSAKKALVAHGFTPALLTNGVFLAGVVMRALAITGQFWLMAQQPLGKIITLMCLVSIMGNNVLGFFLFNETLSMREYLGIGLTLVAFLLLAL